MLFTLQRDDSSPRGFPLRINPIRSGTLGGRLSLKVHRLTCFLVPHRLPLFNNDMLVCVSAEVWTWVSLLCHYEFQLLGHDEPSAVTDYLSPSHPPPHPLQKPKFPVTCRVFVLPCESYVVWALSEVLCEEVSQSGKFGRSWEAIFPCVLFTSELLEECVWLLDSWGICFGITLDHVPLGKTHSSCGQEMQHCAQDLV